jgi:NADP-dependent aldehyde dehydrogenase
MHLTGQNFIGFERAAGGTYTFFAVNPSNNQTLEIAFFEATEKEIDRAAEKAETAFVQYRKKSGKERAVFLEAIAEEILALGDALIERCHLETALPIARLQGERSRTVGQLRLFAALLQDGSWVNAKIDTPLPDRQPLPRPDIRQMQIPLGTVGVFGASNFPLAFSVAGGDTVSALAAGCTVIVKAHPAHPGTSEMVAQAILEAAKKTQQPDGVFSMLHGVSNNVGLSIVQHHFVKAIGFTGSYQGGRAIFDEANRRLDPIPVYAEMGSTNPIFILPEAMAQQKNQLAEGLKNSVTMGVGQFCTNPGLTIAIEGSDTAQFMALAQAQFETTSAATMLTPVIQQRYENSIETLIQEKQVDCLARGNEATTINQGIARLLKTDANTFSQNPNLEKEVFGPSTLLVIASDKEELLDTARYLEGHLTATVHGTTNDLEEFSELISILQRKVGRLLINGFPTGVEVCHAMVHGGPFPATTDARMTSVGTAAITRFTRPICFQNFPDFLLPDELKEANPLGIWRLVDGVLQKSQV